MSPADALRYASGMSTQELAGPGGDGSWPGPANRRPSTLSPHHLFWVVAFAALAMRTTRWRLG